jgi:hypothetical protein
MPLASQSAICLMHPLITSIASPAACNSHKAYFHIKIMGIGRSRNWRPMNKNCIVGLAFDEWIFIVRLSYRYLVGVKDPP